MKLLLDAHLNGAEEVLKQKGWEVILVKDLGITDEKGSARDAAIADKAKEKGYCVVTMDKRMASKCETFEAECLLISIDSIAKQIDERLKNRNKKHHDRS